MTKQLDRIHLGKRLLRERTTRGLTVRDVENILRRPDGTPAVSRSTLSRAERGSPECFQNAETILLLSDYYGFDARAYLVSVQPVSRETPHETNAQPVATDGEAAVSEPRGARA